MSHVRRQVMEEEMAVVSVWVVGAVKRASLLVLIGFGTASRRRADTRPLSLSPSRVSTPPADAVIICSNIGKCDHAQRPPRSSVSLPYPALSAPCHGEGLLHVPPDDPSHYPARRLKTRQLPQIGPLRSLASSAISLAPPTYAQDVSLPSGSAPATCGTQSTTKTVR